MSSTIPKNKIPQRVKDKKSRADRDHCGDGGGGGSELVRLKDEQIKKMIERISSLHTYNGQFSIENEELKKENLQLRQSVATIKRKFDELRTKECLKCESWQSQKQLLESETKLLSIENVDLKNDLEMMKILVYRLNVQLERKRDTSANAAAPLNNNFTDVPDTFNWGTVKTNVLAPLLNSYEEIVDEKNSIIRDIERELSVFGTRLEEVVQENERLSEEISKRDSSGNKWETERLRLQSQLDVCRKRADLQTKRADVLQEKLVEVAQCYEQRIQAQTLDLERLTESSGRIREELAAYKGHPNTVKSNEIVVESLRECKSLFEELKKQHEDEKQRLSEELKEFKVQLSTREEELRKSQFEINNLQMILDKQKECNEALNNKIILLKDAVHRLKKSREQLKSKIKIHHQPETIRPSDLQKWQEMLRQKSIQMHSMQIAHSNQMEKMSRKLQYKEGIVKKLLQDQLKGLDLKGK